MRDYEHLPEEEGSDDDERDREKQREEPQPDLGADHLGLVVMVPRHAQEEDDDGKDDDEMERREGEGAQRLL